MDARWAITVGLTTRVLTSRPAFTDNEGADTAATQDDVALTVRAKADGNSTTQNLWLLETGRFTGRYVGFVRLTDADGDGGIADAQNNWGLQTKNADGESMNGAAVLGVQSGPVAIEYGDTDGKSRTLSIAIDTVPPSIQIDVPVNNSRGRDTTPLFAGSYADADSGLREDSFRLYIDNSNDTEESGGNDTGNVLALDLTVDQETDPSGYVANMPVPIRSEDQYTGYGADASGTPDYPDQFGVARSRSNLRPPRNRRITENTSGDRGRQLRRWCGHRNVRRFGAYSIAG